MPFNPALTQPEIDLPPYDPADDAEFYREMLDEIMETAMQLVRVISEKLRTDPDSGGPATTLALDRIARTIRRCMLLSLKLSESRPVRTTSARARSEARSRVRAEVQAALSRAPPPTDADADADTAETESETESGNRPKGPESLDRIGPGTIPEIIAGLCQDLARIATQLGQPTQRRPRPPRSAPATTPKIQQHPTSTPKRPKAHHRHHRRPPNPARGKGSG